MAVVGRTGRRGQNGTLSPITARKRSGRRRAACQATGAPQSWPATTAVGSPSASSRPTPPPAQGRQGGGGGGGGAGGAPPAPAARVRGHRVVAGLGQRGELVAPRVPRLRKAVAEHHQRSRALLGQVHADPVCLDRAVPDHRAFAVVADIIYLP